MSARRLLAFAVVVTVVIVLALVFSGRADAVEPTEGLNRGTPGEGNYEPTAAEREDAESRALICSWHYSTDYDEVGSGARHWEFGEEVFYRNCRGNGQGRFVDPLTWTHLCKNDTGPLSGLQDFKFNIWLYERGGDRDVNPDPVTMECPRGPGWHEMEIGSPVINHLRRCAAGVPRWDVDGKIRLTIASDKVFALRGNMWGYIGPSGIDC